MFEVVVMVCLAATGLDCKEFKLPEKQYPDVVTCIRDSQEKGAEWQLANNRYTIIGTRCVKNPDVPDAPKS